MKIESYYDIGCSICGHYRSTDFGKGMEIIKQDLKLKAKEEGWICEDKKNICPNCYKKRSNKKC